MCWALLALVARAQAPAPLPSPAIASPSAAAPSEQSALAQPNQAFAGPAPSNSAFEAQLQALELKLEEQQQRTHELEQRLESIEPSAEGGAQALPASMVEALEGDGGGHLVGSDLNMKARWNNGLELETESKDFRFHLGGRYQFDSVWFASSPAFVGTGGVGDAAGVDFRRARLRADGTIYEVIDFAIEYDFANTVNDNNGLQPASDVLGNIIGVPAGTDLWWNIKNLPFINNLRIGSQKEPIGFEHLTSSRYLDFMERSFNQDAYTGPFNNGFTPGIQAYNSIFNERACWATGLFKNNNNAFNFGLGDGEGAWTSRVTWLPWYDEPSNGRYLWHVGASSSFRSPEYGRVRIRTRPSLRNGPGASNPLLLDTSYFGASSQQLFGGETAFQYGPLLIQSEYMAEIVNNSTFGGVNFGTYTTHGYYGEVLYFLTGENRVYDRKVGFFTRPFVHENAFAVRAPRRFSFGRGAWQVGCRYSQLDLNNGGLNLGMVHDITAGVNWFWNPNMKVQFNYVATHRESAGGLVVGDINGFGMRVAQDF